MTTATRVRSCRWWSALTVGLALVGCGGGGGARAHTPGWPGPVGAPVDCAVTEGYDDIVIGAGLAGLAAARELQRFGHRVIVLEASDHVGGRGFTYQVGGGDHAVPIDLGGAWVHGVETNPLTAVVDSLGLRRVRSNLDEPYYLGGHRATAEEQAAFARAEEAFADAMATAVRRVRGDETPAAFCESALYGTRDVDRAARLAFCNGLHERTDATTSERECVGALALYCDADVQAALDRAASAAGDGDRDQACLVAWEAARTDAGEAARHARAEPWLAPARWTQLGAVSCDFRAGRGRDRAAYYLPIDDPLRAFMEQNLGPLDSAGELRETSAVDIGEFAEGEDDLVAEGMGTFVARYGAHAPVCLDSPVTRVEHDAAGVRVAVGERVYRGQHALVTVSTGVLAHQDAEGAYTLAFAPPLSAAKRAAIAALSMGAMQKVILRFRRDVFTGARDSSWVLYEDPATHEIMAFVLKPFGEPVAIGFYGGARARAYEAACKDVGFDPRHPEAQPCDRPAVDTAKAALATMFGVASIDAELDGPAYVTRWSLHPWTRGAYAVVAPGAVAEREVLAAPVPGGDQDGAPARLFFAGEGTARSIYSGSFAGSYESGLRAAREIIAHGSERTK